MDLSSMHFILRNDSDGCKRKHVADKFEVTSMLVTDVGDQVC